MPNTAIQNAAEMLKCARHVIALTGAGISVESGIPDFRSVNGIWKKYPPEKYATLEAYLHNPDEVWKFWYELGGMLKGVKPNPGHASLAALENLGYLKGVITQNIDNLHQDAGNSHVIEFHGNAGRLSCLQCHTRKPLNLNLPLNTAPRCTCGGLMKPDVILFGEMLPSYAVLESEILIQECDTLLVIGTSATVFPAADFPYIAKQNGANIIEYNLETTVLTNSVTDIFVQGPSGKTLPEVLKHLSALHAES